MQNTEFGIWELKYDFYSNYGGIPLLKTFRILPSVFCLQNNQKSFNERSEINEHLIK